MRSLSTPTCRSTLAKRSRSFIVISCPNPPRPPASPAVHPGLFIFQPLQDQFAMPLESTKSLLKGTQHRHGNVDVMAAVFQLFNQPFLFGDVLLASRDMAIGLGQMLAFTVRIDHGHLFLALGGGGFGGLAAPIMAFASLRAPQRVLRGARSPPLFQASLPWRFRPSFHPRACAPPLRVRASGRDRLH